VWVGVVFWVGDARMRGLLLRWNMVSVRVTEGGGGKVPGKWEIWGGHRKGGAGVPGWGEAAGMRRR
jgi:hypothetical protein